MYVVCDQCWTGTCAACRERDERNVRDVYGMPLAEYRERCRAADRWELLGDLAALAGVLCGVVVIGWTVLSLCF